MTKIKFFKNAIKYDGKRIRVWYSKGRLTNYPEGTITIYAKDYGSQLPIELKPENDTDSMTDYFDKDRARVEPESKYYNEIKGFVGN